MTSEVERGQSVIVSILDEHDDYFTHPRLDIGTASIDVKCW